jgi:hypothetical protein
MQLMKTIMTSPSEQPKMTRILGSKGFNRLTVMRFFMASVLIVYVGLQYKSLSMMNITTLPIEDPFQSMLRFTSQKIEHPVPGLRCGTPWSEARQHVKGIDVSSKRPLIWTVSGGNEYRSYLAKILKQWQTIDLSPLLMVALDAETSDHVCELGYQTVIWDLPQTSYSRVADSKFEIAAALAEMGVWAFFMEVDVFCKVNPLYLFVDSEDDDYGLVVPGHAFADFVPNIGQYYVRPSQRVADYFRSIAEVLKYSRKHKDYLTHTGNVREFFDQRIFYHCLPPTNPIDADYKPQQAMYLPGDRKNNILALCRNVSHTRPFRWRAVSNIYISANNPPIIYDSTVCIHPLSDEPFASFSLKMATSKYFGYDPDPIKNSDRFLKTITGDLTFNECWVFPFLGDDMFPRDVFIHGRFRQFISSLVYFAKATGRTLVLPRHFRDRNLFAVPVLALVDIRTIEAHVPTRYVPIDMDQHVVYADGERDHLLEDIKKSNNQVVAIERFCNLANATIPEAREIESTLRFCLTDPRVKFTRAIGSWSRICGSSDLYKE